VGAYTRLGRSHAEPPGEAFDQSRPAAGAGIPKGGPAIEAAAKRGDSAALSPLFPGARLPPDGGFLSYDFSFKWLQTAVLR